VPSHYQSLVIKIDPCKYLHSLVQEALRVVINEVIVYSIIDVFLVAEAEIIDHPLAFCYLPDFDTFSSKLGTLQNHHLNSSGDHTRHEGSLHCQEDVVSSDNLGIDVVLCECLDCALCIFLQ
jgi:hypothetical protein